MAGLRAMRPGEALTTMSAQDRAERWVVSSVTMYLKSAHDMPASLFDPHGTRHLVLIS